MQTINITLNGKVTAVAPEITILEAARQQGIDLPTLCHHPDQRVKANCRICVVEIEGVKNLVPSCSTRVTAGMNITTNSPRVRETVRTILELIFADHPQECLTCIRNGNCELRQIAAKFGVRDIQGEKRKHSFSQDFSTPSLVRNPDKCIKCGRCAEACHYIQNVGILYSHNRSTEISISPEYGKQLADVACVLCGQCALVCPVGAIHERDDTDRVWEALADPQKHVVVQVAPAVRVSLAEEFGFPSGEIATGKLVSALRSLGFDRVFDTDFSADLTIMEEGHELLDRIANGGVLPMITSCSPGWIKYMEHYYPELIPHLSTCKSPQQMFGALAKTYYAQTSGLEAKDIIVVSVMPCTAKKFEAERPEMNASGSQDVDIVLTTRELGRMLQHEGIDFRMLPEAEFDSPLGISTGAAAIFGATGGVMEAALRTVYEVVTGRTLTDLNFTAVRGMVGVKEASVDLAGTEVKAGIAHGLANAKRILEMIKAGQADYTFIEVMCCPGGCIGGGGQPYGTTNEIRARRIEALYQVDENMPLRKSHENPAVQELYQDFLLDPLGELSHRLLHTQYCNRS
ncbi:Periplasmic [Fe] hydrogenase large subunit [Dehalobacter sp. UNSWDHB]|jgi:hydrogenases, Fe-only|uniref:NADH-dependent [FeFe] hydrogenase, group A6 n=1 Tax=unclassified Dehalobacter TaxID=2635733 RepID=UPI00028A9CC4|nr:MULTISPECIES: NADH-dependent [FeFe] hydrogenase, group A6 [unclassified Dehalobacter]AFV02666.1 [Fe] hydrogenase, large subunit HymC [Dehalobacter sp. DCA]AFV05651.1 [Fe] hydrogenase, large subunit HymC [Dehalobacter sp. CF]EQB21248.1 Periplasmic [Fe] hydrogenase large subunit [Dehalobacter sp. UNSWDHB]